MLNIKIKSFQVNDQFSLNNINLKIKSGSILALIGKSGSGKSSIANLVSGSTISEAAEIAINGKSINTNLDRLFKEFPEIGYVPQKLHLKPNHTVLEFLEMLFQQKTKKEGDKIIKNIIHQFNIKQLIGSKISTLSGGERQKLAIIQAISKPIKALILDEPFSQLDTVQKTEISQQIRELINQLNIPCLMISHDLIDVIQLGDKIAVMEKGKIEFQGTWQQFFTSQKKKMIQLREVIENYINTTQKAIEHLKKLSKG